MALKRIVDTRFWTDDKIINDFSPEDKLFMLYLLTNPHTTQLGIYHINEKIMAFELGYSMETIKVLIDRFENKYEMIKYSKETNEMAIKNYLKYSIIKGGAPVRDCLIKELRQVKDKILIKYVFNNIKNSDTLNDTINKLIKEYEEKNGYILYCNEKNNDNDNDNEVSYHDTLNDTLKKQFKKPTIKEIKNYCEERKNNINAETFYNFYESKGWYVGKNKMKDWKACIRTWEQKNKKENKEPEWFNKRIDKVQDNGEIEDILKEWK